MALSKRNLRGLQDLPTISGKVDPKNAPYKAYMRISNLEMEKARRGMERKSALHRVKIIESRFLEIEAEKASLLQAISEQKINNPIIDASGNDHNDPNLRTGRTINGFKLRY